MSDPGSKQISNLTVLVEQVVDQNKRVLEAVETMQEGVAKIPNIQRDISDLKHDVKTIKAAVTDTNEQVNDHENRITKFEVAA